LGGETIRTSNLAEYFSYTLRQPVGVVAAIIPWNAPVFLFAQKAGARIGDGVHGRHESRRNTRHWRCCA